MTEEKPPIMVQKFLEHAERIREAKEQGVEAFPESPSERVEGETYIWGGEPKELREGEFNLGVWLRSEDQ
ncbi:hypothetical protein PHISP_01887 [Aspergillus sp. HF37]|nr:hypothetical protein PHISP_01887 [Aspergillus sp. HF37]